MYLFDYARRSEVVSLLHLHWQQSQTKSADRSLANLGIWKLNKPPTAFTCRVNKGLNYRIQGHFWRPISLKWLVGSSVDSKVSLKWLVGSSVDCRAAEPLNYIPFSFFKGGGRNLTASLLLSVAKEISKPPFFGSWSPVSIKVYSICSIIDL